MAEVDLDTRPTTPSCGRCGKHIPLNGYGYCYECQDILDEESTAARDAARAAEAAEES